MVQDRRAVAAWYGQNGQYGPPTEVQYRSLPVEVRCGFTHAEFIQTIDKYGEILAVPVRNQYTGDLLGVLSIDCLASAYHGREHPVLAG